MSKHKCVECGEEQNEFMHVMSRLIIEEDGRERTVKELWCLSCVFKQTLFEYNETQKNVRDMFRDTRFMNERDRQDYAFKPPTFHDTELD